MPDCDGTEKAEEYSAEVNSERVKKWVERVDNDRETAEAMHNSVALAKDEIIKEVKDLLFELKKRYDIREAYIFGSYARGNPKEYSNVDIAVVLGLRSRRGSFRDGSPFDETFEIFHEVQQHNSLFEVVCFREEEFSKGETTLSRYIKREGIKIL